MQAVIIKSMIWPRLTWGYMRIAINPNKAVVTVSKPIAMMSMFTSYPAQVAPFKKLQATQKWGRA
jgi:hypothetical protein